MDKQSKNYLLKAFSNRIIGLWFSHQKTLFWEFTSANNEFSGKLIIDMPFINVTFKDNDYKLYIEDGVDYLIINQRKKRVEYPSSDFIVLSATYEDKSIMLERIR